MDEMVRYIFGSLRNSETMFRAIWKSIRKQHLIVKEFEIRNMRCQIEALKTEIKELKQTEGD